MIMPEFQRLFARQTCAPLAGRSAKAAHEVGAGLPFVECAEFLIGKSNLQTYFPHPVFVCGNGDAGCRGRRGSRKADDDFYCGLRIHEVAAPAVAR